MRKAKGTDLKTQVLSRFWNPHKTKCGRRAISPPLAAELR